MKNAALKLPGATWRVSTFIPVLNCFSLLYIGAINGGSLSVLCAILYFAFSLVQPSLSPFLWLVCIIHNSVVYSNIKRQMNEASSMAVSQYTKPSPNNRSQNARGFTEITIAGGFERKQSIPAKPSPTVENSRVSFVSTESSRDKFFRDMQKYAATSYANATFVPFMSYWPTYDDMNGSQRTWYFFWRSQVRPGNYPETDLSYIFVYVYELLSGIGWTTPQEGYDLLLAIWSAYQERYPKLDHYLSAWVFDFAQLHGLPHSAPVIADSAHQLSATLIDTFVANYAEDTPLKLPFALIDALCDYSLVSSKFYKEGNQGLIQDAIPRVIALIDAVLRKNTQKGLLETYGPNRSRKQEYYAFRSALCPQADQKLVITVRPYSTDQRLRGFINELVRYAENTLREIKGCRGRLRGVALDDNMAKMVEGFLKKEYGKPSPQIQKHEKRKEVTLDFDSIEALREQSDAVRTALQVEEVVVSAPKALLTDVHEVTAIYVSLSPKARQLLDRLERAGWECEQASNDVPFISEINRFAEHYLGCALLVIEGATIIVEDDYRDELEYIYENPPEVSSTAGNSSLFKTDCLSPNLKGFVDHLMPEQKKALYVLLTCEHPQVELERIAEDAATMPQIVLDELNSLAIQTVGDLVVDTMNQEPHILDEYIDLLKQSIA